MSRYSVKVKAHRSNIVHWGEGIRNISTECGAGKVSTGARYASAYIKQADSAEVTCKRCIKLHAAIGESAPAPIPAVVNVDRYAARAAKIRAEREAKVEWVTVPGSISGNPVNFISEDDLTLV